MSRSYVEINKVAAYDNNINIYYIYSYIQTCKSYKRSILGAPLHWRRSYVEINKVAAHAKLIYIYIYVRSKNYKLFKCK